MWSAITKIFAKNSSNNEAEGGGYVAVAGGRAEQPNEMDDTFMTKQAKQRASVKWLLSKAYNNKVPESLKEPFYRDHENQEHLKPQILGGLASAEIYCVALANIYSDPNYNNLNHSAILQTLARKGVYVSEPSDSQLTETTLIQTNPLRMSAHMAVIESIMLLYTREVVTPDRVLAAVQRFNYGKQAAPSMPDSPERGLFLWMAHACDALRKRIEQDLDPGIANGAGDRLKPPELPSVRELKDLSDGVALAALISYYCPDELPWTDLKVSYVPNVQDSLYNLNLVREFCNRCLPSLIFHITPEDVTYMRDSMRQNLLVFLADLFNVIEIHPAQCVRYPGMERLNEGFPPRNEHGVVHKRNLLQTVMTPIPDLRSGLDDPSVPTTFQVSKSTPTHMPLRKANSLQQSQQSIMTDMTEDSLRRGSEDSSFVVHRGKNIPTLRSVVQDEPQVPPRTKMGVKEILNNDSKADERGEVAAGKPSNWEDSRKSSFAGRRSRRNSTSDDSQLTIENFGGSQDNLNFIGRNPDKEVGVHVGRKISAPSFPMEPVAVAVRSSLQDAKGSIQLGYDNGCEKRDEEPEKYKLKRQLSSDDISLRNIIHAKESIKDVIDGEVANRMSFAELTKPKVGEYRGIQLVYMQHDKDDLPNKPASSNGTTGGEKRTSFAALPNTTTWQQQSNNLQQADSTSGGDGGQSSNLINAAQLNDVRMKLEEKRRLIESEKRRVELAMSKQRQKVGKAAFLQAISKGRGNLLKTPTDAESNSNSATGSESQSPSSESAPPKPQRPFTLQEINDDTSAVEQKWLNDGQPFIEPRRTPDLENMDLEQYQQSIAQMNSSLHDIQGDIQRLASQQSQIQVAQQQSLLAQQQKQIQVLQQQQYQSIHQQQQQQQQQQHNQHQQHQQSQQHQHHYAAPQMYQPPMYQQQPQQQQQQSQYGGYAPPLQSSASAPHIPHILYQQNRIPEQSQFFLHDHSSAQAMPPITPPRRTWAQQQPTLPPLISQSHQSQDVAHTPELRTWNRTQSPAGFVLHDTSDRYETPKYQPDYRYAENTKFQNGGEPHNLHHSNSFTLSQQHLHNQQHQQSFGTSHSTPSASPQHRSNIHRQISQLLDESKRSPVSLQQMDVGHHDTTVPLRKSSSVTHAPIPAPSADDMEPQNISFIGNADDQLSEGLSRLNITSGSRTYRIPSPTRPLITRNSFQPSPTQEQREPAAIALEVSSLDSDPTNKKGFYIQFDDDQPKRPKPPLRTKKMSPKKERSYVEEESDKREADRVEKRKQLERELDEERQKKEMEDRRRQSLIEQEREKLRAKREASQERQKVAEASTLVIGDESSNPDPDLAERMKKRILLASLQRKQEQEEAKARKEQEAQAWREREKAKEEEKIRKKEEQAARRAAILEQYKLKKAMEEAEREGKVFDKSELMGSLKPTPKMRPKAAARPRPKTIHIDSGSVEMAEGMLQPSRGKKGSISNLTGNSMKRDYYRGSQDSLADRSMSSGMLYRDSPDDSRGMSPCHSANQTLGRRSSYKTSRDPSPAQVRGRPKYSNYQNFKGRKSSSLMNLYGSSTDQDSLAYRYGDTDSGLGRATPPRRAPSPGMGSMRHLPSPSGPGSLPGFMTKGRRMFDDGSSDISSTPSSMMDYTGPRLYKQPATKSNRGIMLNAVEYCVFPGVVNKEAKKRVLEEISRSESKHFLILFRDAGCQFRALYSYCPDREEVTKLYGTGPKQVNDRMFDKFFKYNSGGKCFSQVHTKHLTVTIDAFTIHNSLWQGKKVNLPSKKDMALVI